MKAILDLIAAKQQTFASLPLFQFLQDSSIDPRQRLAFAPIFAPFVIGFGELNRSVFREEPTPDPIQLIINQHSREDDSHWVWFLEDLKKLELDRTMRFTDSLKFLWGEETRASRHLIYELYRLTYQAHPIRKLIIIEAIEATADIFLGATTRAARDLQALTHQEYRYFGDLHFAIDTSHSIHLTETEELIASLPLTDEAQQEAEELVEIVFQLFSNYFTEVFQYLQTPVAA